MLRHLVLALSIFGASAVNASAGQLCQTTLPVNPAFVPPAPYAQQPQPGNFWYGSSKLWTQLPIDGTWRPATSDGTFKTKLVFYQQGFDWRAHQPKPGLILTARRLDGEAPAVAIDNAQAAFVTTKTPAIMVGLGLPTPGCWRITAFYDGAALDFVVSVTR